MQAAPRRAGRDAISKIEPRTPQYKSLYGETANGSLKPL